VTGFAAFFSIELASANFNQASALFLVPLFFLLGSMVSGILVDLRLKLKKKPKYYIVFGVLFLLNMVVVIGGFNQMFGQFGEPLKDFNDYTLLCLLCFICGVQNGTITLVSKSVVRTTHLTGMTTDLGIGIIRYFNRKRLAGKIEDEGIANVMRFGIITSFLVGSILGVKIFGRLGFRGFILPCGISFMLFFATFYFQVLRGYFGLAKK
jgi:uncharacterized membrane protein YoaK (UPF0700 family)